MLSREKLSRNEKYNQKNAFKRLAEVEVEENYIKLIRERIIKYIWNPAEFQ